MSVVMNFVMGLASAGGIYFWAKTQLFKPDLSNDRDIFPSRGVPLSKRVRTAVADKDNPGNKSVKLERVTNAADLERETVVELAVKSEPIMKDSTPIAAACIEASKDVIPEDSVLKRHYFTRRIAERTAITHPYPTDSVLRRHHESRLAISLLQDRVVEKKAETAEPSAVASEHHSPPQAVVAIPEDSVLKRHFMAQQQAEIEQDLLAKRR